ncbi:hypothetical protein EMPG_10608 [Blastomyces silverae]|uniref:DNA-directed RNA polymerase III subunit RPC9 n=1 Tax=Blastomyces silverae TaxID=2060906 RepID=A0A0H1B3P2_9EURO|nr:hypothetical protein EMPG_10608 [Blastomyces silverae]
MKILEPQSAILTNVEVLAHFSLNPPRRPPNPPPNSRNFTPTPDLRDHNTVVKEFHDYVTRLSPHLLSYPSFTPPKPEANDKKKKKNNNNNDNNDENTNNNATGDGNNNINTTSTSTSTSTPLPGPPTQSPTSLQSQTTDLDNALREIIRRLRPFQLTKAEVLMIVNLGVGLDASAGDEGNGEGGQEEEEGGAAATEEGTADGMDVDGEGGGEQRGEGEGEGEEEEADYGALALLDTVIEDREERLSTEDVGAILRIVRETLGAKGRGSTAAAVG